MVVAAVAVIVDVGSGSCGSSGSDKGGSGRYWYLQWRRWQEQQSSSSAAVVEDSNTASRIKDGNGHRSRNSSNSRKTKRWEMYSLP